MENNTFDKEYMDSLDRLYNDHSKLTGFKWFLDTAYSWAYHKNPTPNAVILGTAVPEEIVMAAGAKPYWLTGGNFCNFCPAVAVSPILAGMSTSLYVSGFLMVLVLMGGFFKRRAFCTICPLGTIMGFFHKISLFRVKKDCQSCTECGACYEACPMGIKIIYTEREKADVTHANCIMCGECVKCCPEDNALSLTFAGKKIYTFSRQKIMSGYKQEDKK